MTFSPSVDDSAEAWRSYANTWRAWRLRTVADADTEVARRTLLALDPGDLAALLHDALAGHDREPAIALLRNLNQGSLTAIFSDLVQLTSFAHGAIQRIREAIQALPRDWVLEHVDAVSEPLLLAGDWETYRRLLELYLELDTTLTRRLADRAAVQLDLDTREAGEDFLERLDGTAWSGGVPPDVFSTWLREHFVARGLTIPEVASRYGHTKTSVRDYLNGRYRPRPKHVPAFANAIGVEPNELRQRLGVVGRQNLTQGHER